MSLKSEKVEKAGTNRLIRSDKTLVDTAAVSKTIFNSVKRRILGKSTYGNEYWNKANNRWYEEIHDSNYLLHEDFIRYFNKIKSNIKSILEVGCGTGIYPIKHKDMFQDLEYTGIDFSKTNIDFCKNNSNFNFIDGDFIKMETHTKYDLVFSHAVIDHVYNIDVFLTNLIKSCKKFAYINSYRGFFPNLKKHEMQWRDENNCYYNNISIIQIRKILLENNLSEEEFIIREQKSGQTEKNLKTQLVIEIKRK